MDFTTRVIPFRRKIPGPVFLCGLLLLSAFLLFYFSKDVWTHSLLSVPVVHEQTLSQQALAANGPFRALPLHGFDLSTHAPVDQVSCQSLVHSAEVKVQQSFFLEDSLLEIADTLDKHELVEYPKQYIQGNTTKLHTLIAQSWDNFATSCAFLPEQRVYLCVSRVLFHPDKRKDHARINFLRGRIFSESWVHLDGYRLKWQNQKEIVFPTFFDTKTDYKKVGIVWGPEDGRIIIQDAPGAEPVIVFNMIAKKTGWKRALWVYRPFTQRLAVLTINNVTRAKVEKNWSPFFLTEEALDNKPSEYLHFIWHFTPLKVVKCHLETGICDLVYEQHVPEHFLADNKTQNVSLHGGTQFLSIPRLPIVNNQPWGRSDIQAFLSIPRHQIKHHGGCGKPGYRPEFAVLVTNTSHFYFSYISAPVDFGPDTVMPAQNLKDSCFNGRIIVVNNLARWEMGIELPGQPGQKTDVMTISLSVNDTTTQVMRMAGLYDVLRSLPSLTEFFDQKSPVGQFSRRIINSSDLTPSIIPPPVFGSLPNMFESAEFLGWKIESCVEEAALNYTITHSKTPKLFSPA